MITVFRKFTVYCKKKRQRIIIQLYKCRIRKMRVVRAGETPEVVTNSGRIRSSPMSRTSWTWTRYWKTKRRSCGERYREQGQCFMEEKECEQSKAKPWARRGYNVSGLIASGWRNWPGRVTQAESFACYMWNAIAKCSLDYFILRVRTEITKVEIFLFF